MKKVLFSLTLFTAIGLMSSCTQPTVDTASLQAKVDELAAQKIEALNAQATQECETRMATEVKALADSMVQAAMTANAAQ